MTLIRGVEVRSAENCAVKFIRRDGDFSGCLCKCEKWDVRGPISNLSFVAITEMSFSRHLNRIGKNLYNNLSKDKSLHYQCYLSKSLFSTSSILANMRLKEVNHLELPPTADMHVHLRDGPMMELITPQIRRGGVDTVFVMVSRSKNGPLKLSYQPLTCQYSQTWYLRLHQLRRRWSTRNACRLLSQMSNTSCLYIFI